MFALGIGPAFRAAIPALMVVAIVLSIRSVLGRLNTALSLAFASQIDIP